MSEPAGGESPRRVLKGVCWSVLVAGLLALLPVQNRVAAERGTYASLEDVLYFASGSVLSKLSLGNQGLLADLYWTRVVQYFGRKRLDKDVRLDLLGPLLQITVDLDPHLLVAYRFGAVFLAEPPPEGAGRPQEALDLLRKGIVANPDYWRFWQDVGFIYYWDLRDYNKAVKAFETGARQPGAQVWMHAIAAQVSAKGGDIQTSRALWSQIYRQADNNQIRESALEHLAALDAQQTIDVLNQALGAYRKAAGHPAQDLQDLVTAGFIREVPRDPSGIPYVLGRDGQATVGPNSKVKLRLLHY